MQILGSVEQCCQLATQLNHLCKAKQRSAQEQGHVWGGPNYIRGNWQQVRSISTIALNDTPAEDLPRLPVPPVAER